RERVRDHAEVFTSEREVTAMINLVQTEVDRIDSRFLEPACGHGNFLIAILSRKLAVVTMKYRSQQSDWEQYSFQVMASLYGIDLLPDNVIQCRARLVELVVQHYQSLYRHSQYPEFIHTIRFIAERNIICGDALTLLTLDSNQPIRFSEWAMVRDGKVKRRDFNFRELVSKSEASALPLFAQAKDPEMVMLPKVVKDYPPTHFLQLSHVERNHDTPSLPGL
ncbi:MAG: SAM-dependent DNA methyltransferase, partial [Alphaproteobacteria bacterium]|nr:SAM-dependent DNA methyltransferase [Alphaproteobacteria bacterium]